MIQKYLSDGIPTFFKQFETELPFEKCTFCGDGLLHKKYMIEKVLKRNQQFNTSEIIYEYCMCEDCMQSNQSEISEDSRNNIIALYEEHNMNYAMKLEYLHGTEKYNVDSWLENCSFTGKPISQCKEYSACAIVESGNLVYEQFPMVVSDTFIEMVQECLSQETKDSFDGLKDKIIDSSPGVEDIIGTPTFGIM